MKWLEISARVDAEGAEAASELLNRYAYGGVAIEELMSKSGPPRLSVRAYVPADDTIGEKSQVLREAWWHLSRARPLGRLRCRVVDEENWNDAWKRYFTVHHVTPRIVIKPSWRQYSPQPEDVVVELDPGAAFGTGLHPTTKLCLQALEELVWHGMRVLDVGTGSGILAITAAKLGAGEVVAVDIDPVAARVAQENVDLNHVGDQVVVQKGTADAAAGAGFDMIVANIIASVIIDLAPALATNLRPGGKLVASGIIRGRTSEVRASLRAAGLRDIVSQRSGDWLALQAVRPR
ncbi:MAG: 50S ribosomal protein L11 methyltransferase [Chloroflexi bacterium]|nr:50S ribosomal protein L11 methyltransferase [Chloroflexota bacterium]